MVERDELGGVEQRGADLSRPEGERLEKASARASDLKRAAARRTRMRPAATARTVASSGLARSSRLCRPTIRQIFSL